MSTNSTAHYGLCQWEASDQFKRTEFNDDNLKIDSALAALSGAVSTKAEASTVAALSSAVDAKAEASALTALTAKVNAKAEASALETLTAKVNAKAEASAVAALTATVNTKADASTVTALSNRVNAKAETSTVTALTTKVNAKAEASAVTALSSTVNNIIATTLRIEYGSYVGDGTAKRYIPLSITPKVVFVTDQCGGTRLHNGNVNDFGGLALAGIPSEAEKVAGHNVVEIAGNGFYVFYETLSGSAPELIRSNESGKTRHYLAFG